MAELAVVEPAAIPGVALAVVETPEALRVQVDAWRAAGLRVGFVPTMGALHAGHLSLVTRARERADRVVVSIFVNPTQFGEGEDFDAYPRSLERDCETLAGIGCDLVFSPPVEVLYPPGDSTFVEVGGASQGFEGAERPGHFRGVATVVTKLLRLVRPDLAVFGEKDAQQLVVVRRLARDLWLDVEIVGAPIVREADGLAMSSRNVYLDPEARRAATVLHRALETARTAIDQGERRASALLDQVRQVLGTEPAGEVDYVALVDAETFAPIDHLDRAAVLPIAVRFGSTRLLDNLQIPEPTTA